MAGEGKAPFRSAWLNSAIAPAPLYKSTVFGDRDDAEVTAFNAWFFGATPIAYTLTGDAGSYTIAGQDATFTVAYALAGDAGAYTLAGQDATFTVTTASTAYTLDGEAGAYVIAGQDADFVVVTAAPEVVSLGGKGHPARLQNLPTWAVEVRARLVDEDDQLRARVSLLPINRRGDGDDRLQAAAQVLPLVSVASAALVDQPDQVSAAAQVLARIELDMDADGFVQAIKAITRAQMEPLPLRRDGPKLIRGRA